LHIANAENPIAHAKQNRRNFMDPFTAGDRWTGMLQGKRTTKTISQENARECERRIKNYKKLLKKIDEILKNALKEAPWHDK